MSAANRDAVNFVALFGDPVNNSLSPAIHNAAFLAVSINWAYIPFRSDAETLPVIFNKLKNQGLIGANFTFPCKEKAVALCDNASREAAAIQAVNCVRVTDGCVEGDNFDIIGFQESLSELGCILRDQLVLILGVGASARACAVALTREGAAVTLAARDVARPRPGLPPAAVVIRMSEVEEFIRQRSPAMLVNATPSGLRESDTPLFNYDLIPPTCFVYDLNYGRETPLVVSAGRRGLKYTDGLPMLVRQAARSFEFWTGQAAPVEVMRRAAAKELRLRAVCPKTNVN